MESISSKGVEMTEEAIKAACRSRGLYTFPHINSKLYLHQMGFSRIGSLEKYENLQVLHLEGNGLRKVEGLSHLKKLRFLYLQQNIISKIEGIEDLVQLDTLNISVNQLTVLEGLPPGLTSLNAGSNPLSGSVRALDACPLLNTLDLSHCRFRDPCVIEDLRRLRLKVLYLKGCPVVQTVRGYWKVLVAGIPGLLYLDDRPVEAVDHAAAEAWVSGGREAELQARSSHYKEKAERERRDRRALTRMRNEGRLRSTTLDHGSGAFYRPEVAVTPAELLDLIRVVAQRDLARDAEDAAMGLESSTCAGASSTADCEQCIVCHELLSSPSALEPSGDGSNDRAVASTNRDVHAQARGMTSNGGGSGGGHNAYGSNHVVAAGSTNGMLDGSGQGNGESQSALKGSACDSGAAAGYMPLVSTPSPADASSYTESLWPHAYNCPPATVHVDSNRDGLRAGVQMALDSEHARVQCIGVPRSNLDMLWDGARNGPRPSDSMTSSSAVASNCGSSLTLRRSREFEPREAMAAGISQLSGSAPTEGHGGIASTSGTSSNGVGQGGVAILPCGHRYHAACIRAWLAEWSVLCPMCRQQVTREELQAAQGGREELQAAQGGREEPGPCSVQSSREGEVDMPALTEGEAPRPALRKGEGMPELDLGVGASSLSAVAEEGGTLRSGEVKGARKLGGLHGQEAARMEGVWEESSRREYARTAAVSDNRASGEGAAEEGAQEDDTAESFAQRAPRDASREGGASIRVSTDDLGVAAHPRVVVGSRGVAGVAAGDLPGAAVPVMHVVHAGYGSSPGSPLSPAVGAKQIHSSASTPSRSDPGGSALRSGSTAGGLGEGEEEGRTRVGRKDPMQSIGSREGGADGLAQAVGVGTVPAASEKMSGDDEGWVGGRVEAWLEDRGPREHGEARREAARGAGSDGADASEMTMRGLPGGSGSRNGDNDLASASGCQGGIVAHAGTMAVSGRAGDGVAGQVVGRNDEGDDARDLAGGGARSSTGVVAVHAPCACARQRQPLPQDQRQRWRLQQEEPQQQQQQQQLRTPMASYADVVRHGASISRRGVASALSAMWGRRWGRQAWCECECGAATLHRSLVQECERERPGDGPSHNPDPNIIASQPPGNSGTGCGSRKEADPSSGDGATETLERSPCNLARPYGCVNGPAADGAGAGRMNITAGGPSGRTHGQAWVRRGTSTHLTSPTYHGQTPLKRGIRLDHVIALVSKGPLSDTQVRAHVTSGDMPSAAALRIASKDIAPLTRCLPPHLPISCLAVSTPAATLATAAASPSHGQSSTWDDQSRSCDDQPRACNGRTASDGEISSSSCAPLCCQATPMSGGGYAAMGRLVIAQPPMRPGHGGSSQLAMASCDSWRRDDGYGRQDDGYRRQNDNGGDASSHEGRPQRVEAGPRGVIGGGATAQALAAAAKDGRLVGVFRRDEDNKVQLSVVIKDRAPSAVGTDGGPRPGRLEPVGVCTDLACGGSTADGERSAVDGEAALFADVAGVADADVAGVIGDGADIMEEWPWDTIPVQMGALPYV
eukprot:jgi/Mesvir1/19195/Mv11512-RA.2